jgi:glycerol-3-phosphate dehydrogenase (NAD(P)+)
LVAFDHKRGGILADGGEISRIAVIGAGSWGTALGNMLARKGCEVNLWVREATVFRQIERERINKDFLPGVELFPALRPVSSFEEAVRYKELVLLVIPSHVFREVLTALRPYLDNGMTLMAATKGIENDTLMVMSQVAETILPATYHRTFACMGGPSFAREVSVKSPTAVTIACRDSHQGTRLQEVFHTDFFRVYTTEDIMGVQLGGALKNVIAIAAGAADGLKFGHNARAALITRGLAEITRLGVAMGANPHTFAGLAGMGDLVLTCTGDLSRNRTVGLKIAGGMTLDEIVNGMNMVAEGIRTARSAYELSRRAGVEMPITTQVYQILYENKDPMKAVSDLMSRELRSELEY